MTDLMGQSISAVRLKNSKMNTVDFVEPNSRPQIIRCSCSLTKKSEVEEKPGEEEKS